MDSRVIAQGPRAGEQRERDVYLVRWPKQSRLGQHHAASQIAGGDIVAGKIQGGALTGDGFIGGGAVNLHAAHPGTGALRKDLDLVIFAHPAGDERAGYYGAKSLHAEDAINGQAKVSRRVLGRDLADHAGQFSLQLFESGASLGVNGNNWRPPRIEERPAQKIAGLRAHHRERFGVNQVALGEHGKAAADGEQPADIKVLAGLRLDAFVGGHYKQQQIHAAGAGQHVANETLMSGDIHKSQAQHATARRGQLHVGEAEINRDAAAFLLGQAVSVNAGERLYQLSFAVVNVAGGAHDDGP